MPSFVDKLRMQGIFSGPGLGPPTMAQPLDINSIMSNVQGENELERAHEIKLAEMRNPPQLRQIAQRSVQAPMEKPMNVIYRPDITEFQRGTLASRDRDRASRENIASGRLNLGQEQIASREGMLDTRGEQVMDQINRRGDITGDQIDQRGNIVSRQIGERGDVGSRQIKERGAITDRQIGARGQIQKDIQETRGGQGLDAIAARGRETRLTNDVKNDMFTPSETKTSQDLATRELVNTRPDLGELITIGTGGKIEISPEASPEQRDEIASKIFVTRPKGDISLPSSRTQSMPAPKYNNQGKVVKKVQVTKGGKKYMLPEDQVADATKQGYSVVK